MDPHTKSSLLWGLVGLLSFLVLIQGYELATGQPVDLVVKAVMAVLVGFGATALTYWSHTRLPATDPVSDTDDESESP